MARSEPSLLPACSPPPHRPVPGCDGHAVGRAAGEGGCTIWEGAGTGGLGQPSSGSLLQFKQIQAFAEGLLLPFRVESGYFLLVLDRVATGELIWRW